MDSEKIFKIVPLQLPFTINGQLKRVFIDLPPNFFQILSSPSFHPSPQRPVFRENKKAGIQRTVLTVCQLRSLYPGLAVVCFGPQSGSVGTDFHYALSAALNRAAAPLHGFVIVAVILS